MNIKTDYSDYVSLYADSSQPRQRYLTYAEVAETDSCVRALCITVFGHA